MKSLFRIFVSLSLAVLAVFFTNDVVGSNLNRGEIVGAGAAVSVGYTLIHNLSPEGTFSNTNQTVLTELFTGQLIEKLRTMQNWISVVTNRDEYVGNNVIHLNEIGADPTVLINNTVYPIAISNRTDNDVPLALNKYETTNTRITDDELYAITYDKVDSVVNQHKETLAERIGNHIHWSLTPPANNVAAKSFVVRTTGPTIGTRRRLVRADLIALSTQLSNANVPLENRHIILCPEHVEDLLIEDTNLQNQLTDQGNGRASARIAGFNLWFSSYAPHFDNTGAKKAFGSAIVSTDRFASTVFYGPRTWKAYGDTKMYVQLAEAAPTTRETVAGFRQYAAGGLNNLEGSGAVVSAVV